MTAVGIRPKCAQIAACFCIGTGTGILEGILTNWGRGNVHALEPGCGRPQPVKIVPLGTDMTCGSLSK